MDPNVKDKKRLLRLVVTCFFSLSKYSNGRHIASGRFGSVMSVNLDGKSKMLNKSLNGFDDPCLTLLFNRFCMHCEFVLIQQN